MKINVLIAEDNLVSATMLKQILEGNNANVTHSLDGESAYEEAIKNNYDIIFMDYQMPKLNGIESSQKIKFEVDRQRKPAILIIACCASNKPHEKKAWNEVGVKDLLVKPITNQQIKEILHNNGFSTGDEKDTQLNELVENRKDKVYSLDKIIGMSRGNSGFVYKMIRLFIEETPALIAEIESMIAAKDFQRVRAIVHRIKPSIKMLGMDAISNNVQKIEDLCEQNIHLDSVETLFKPVKTVCAVAIENMKTEPVYINNIVND